MEISGFVELAKLFGVPGLLVGVIYWIESNHRKDRKELHDRLAEERKERLDIDKEATSVRLQLACALEALKTVVMGRPHV